MNQTQGTQEVGQPLGGHLQEGTQVSRGYFEEEQESPKVEPLEEAITQVVQEVQTEEADHQYEEYLA